MDNARTPLATKITKHKLELRQAHPNWRPVCSAAISFIRASQEDHQTCSEGVNMQTKMQVFFWQNLPTVALTSVPPQTCKNSFGCEMGRYKSIGCDSTALLHIISALCFQRGPGTSKQTFLSQKKLPATARGPGPGLKSNKGCGPGAQAHAQGRPLSGRRAAMRPHGPTHVGRKKKITYDFYRMLI